MHISFKAILILALIPILATLVTENFVEAKAMKAEGKPVWRYGSATAGIVCGDRLCSEIPREDVAPQVKEETVSEKPKGLFASAMDYTVSGPEIDPEKGYAVVEIGDGLYWIADGNYQMMFLTTGQGVVVVDAPMGLGDKILQAISDVTSEPLTHLIYTHIHKDHIGSAGIFPDNIEIIAHIDTAKHLAMKNDPDRPLPTTSFAEQYTLQVGDQVLELSYIGAFHSKGDIVVYSPAHKVVMAVDLFHPAAAPFQYFGIARDMNEHILAHDKLLAMDFDVIISGHEPILGTPEHLQFNKEFTLSVLDNVYAAMQVTPPSATYIGDLAQKCAEITVEQFSDLKDIEVSPVENCVTMVFYAMID